MNIINLAVLLMDEMKWGYEDLAKRCGLKRQSVYENIQRTTSGKKQRGIFPIMILRLAIKNGLQAEAFTVLLGESLITEVATVVRAGVLYPDLTPDELSKLREVEKMTNLSSLDDRTIRSVINKSRSC